MSDKKLCNKCGLEKSLREFSPRIDGILGRASHCRKCRNQKWRNDSESINIRRRRVYKNSPHKRLRLACASARYRKNHEKKLALHNKNKYKKIRIAVIEKYGGKCACCGEATIEFLAIDHIGEKGVGSKDRKLNGGSTGIYRKLYREMVTMKNYRVLCHNCNSSLGFYGYCPHKIFSIADPDDGGSLDVVGFDTATPQIISDFVIE